jgi:hypothetical protein
VICPAEGDDGEDGAEQGGTDGDIGVTAAALEGMTDADQDAGRGAHAGQVLGQDRGARRPRPAVRWQGAGGAHRGPDAQGTEEADHQGRASPKASNCRWSAPRAAIVG